MDSADADGSEADASSSDSMSAGHEDSTSVPGTDMQRLRQELLLRTRRMARRHKQLLRLQQAGITPAAAAAAADATGEQTVPATLNQKLDSIRAMIKANADRWGTTQQSPAEIAQQIADSNRAAGGAGGDGDGEGEGSDDDEPLALTPGEERYADASTVGAELKQMDEIFEVLAKVRSALHENCGGPAAPARPAAAAPARQTVEVMRPLGVFSTLCLPVDFLPVQLALRLRIEWQNSHATPYQLGGQDVDHTVLYGAAATRLGQMSTFL
jgi:hypothetical protein